MSEIVDLVPVASTAVVEVKVLTTPAVIDFNHVELSAYLDTLLAKYEGLVFTEAEATKCKTTIAELRKNQKSLDDFRLATKRDLTSSVTAFEAQCKTISLKYDAVIDPLTKQQDKFETDRKEKKRAEVQAIIDALILEYALTDAYTKGLVITAEYLTKGKTLKAIKAELTSTANTAKLQQDKAAQDAALITMKVDLSNALQGLAAPLMLAPYLELLAFKTVLEVDALITKDAETAKAREVKFAEDLAAKALEAALTASIEKVDAALAASAERVNAAVSEQNTAILKEFGLPASAASIIAAAPDVRCPAPTLTFTAAPFRVDPLPTPDGPGLPLITAIYKVTGNEDELANLETYFDRAGLQWIDIPNEGGA